MFKSAKGSWLPKAENFNFEQEFYDRLKAGGKKGNPISSTTIWTDENTLLKSLYVSAGVPSICLNKLPVCVDFSGSIGFECNLKPSTQESSCKADECLDMGASVGFSGANFGVAGVEVCIGMRAKICEDGMKTQFRLEASFFAGVSLEFGVSLSLLTDTCGHELEIKSFHGDHGHQNQVPDRKRYS